MRLLWPCLIGLFVASASAAESVATTQPAARTSLWGGAVGGVHGRFQSAIEVQQNAALPVTLELQCDPDFLPNGITRLNTFLYPAHCQLRLVNIASGKQFNVEPYDPTSGMPVPDGGNNIVVLDGKAITRLTTQFPLRLAGPELQPGDFDCTISYSTDRLGNVRPRAGAEFWSGEVVSAPLRVKVTAEIPRPQTVLVPTSLHVDADGKVRFHSQDAQSLQMAIGNGMFLGTTVSGADGDLMSMGSGPPEMDGVNAIADLSNSPPGKTMTCTIEVFETSDPPHHMWMTADRKTLWKKTLSVATTRPTK